MCLWPGLAPALKSCGELTRRSEGDHISSPTSKGWQVSIPASPGQPQVFDLSGALVATFAAPRNQAAADAILLAYAPLMLAALRQCAMVLQVIQENDPGPSGNVAATAIPQIDHLLRGPLDAWSDGPRGV